VLLAREEDEETDPVDVRLFRSLAVMQSPDPIAHLLEQAWWAPLCRAAKCHEAFPRVVLNAVYLYTHADGVRKTCTEPEGVESVSYRFAEICSRTARGVMRRMRRITPYHAHPPHNTPRERLGSGRKLLILDLMLRRTLCGAGYYAALRPPIYSWAFGDVR